LLSQDTSVASTAEAFTQFAPCAASRRHLFSDHKLRFAFPTQIFFSVFHWAVTGRNSHGAKLDTGFALLAEIGAYSKGIFNMAVYTPPDKALRPCLPDFLANPYRLKEERLFASSILSLMPVMGLW